MLDDQAFDELLNRGAPPPRVTLMNSLRLEFDRSVLVRLLAASLHERGVRVVGGNDADPAIERLRVIDFMEWCNGRDGPVLLELFPAGEYGIEELTDLLERDSDADDEYGSGFDFGGDEPPDFPF